MRVSTLSYGFACLFLISLLGHQAQGQSAAAIFGKVTDKDNNEGLPGATIRVVGSTIGTITDAYGEYFLAIKREGQVEIEISFLGFERQTFAVELFLGTITEVNANLESSSLQMEEIVVTGQALGQMAAINQQIQAKSIVNIVSKDKIESLPDQNAAESVGRLPGISIQREGGEGQKVVVRGLSPRFNAITINGERIPSSSAVDRSFDLST